MDFELTDKNDSASGQFWSKMKPILPPFLMITYWLEIR